MNNTPIKICAKGDYNLLSKIPEIYFTEAELYLRTKEDCSLKKFSELPHYLNMISVHQPIYVGKGNKLQHLDLMKEEVKKESIESVKKTFNFAKKCKIPNVVLHCSSYHPEQNKGEVIKELAETMKPFYSNDFSISFETDAHWLNTYYPRRNLLVNAEDFEELDKAVESRLLITADIEHLILSPIFHLVKEQSNLEYLDEKDFTREYRSLIKNKDNLVKNKVKSNISDFFDKFKDKINHIHICGSDYKKYTFDPKTFLPLLGEHLPLGYKDGEVQDRNDYRFLMEQFGKLPKNKEVHTVIEMGIRNNKYDFIKEMYRSKLFMEKSWRSEMK